MSATDEPAAPRRGSQGANSSFDEFKLYYESTERVTERRISANRWNYSLVVGILLAVSAIYTWSLHSRTYFLLGAVATGCLAFAAGLFCFFWLRQIESFKELNNAKFTVLNDMAKRLAFHDANGTVLSKSFRPFEREWGMLRERNGVHNVRVRLKTLEALNSSGAELFIPRALMILFGGIFVGVCVSIGLRWDDVPHTLAPVVAPSTPPTPTPTPTQGITPSPPPSPAPGEVSPSVRP